MLLGNRRMGNQVIACVNDSPPEALLTGIDPRQNEGRGKKLECAAEGKRSSPRYAIGVCRAVSRIATPRRPRCRRSRSATFSTTSPSPCSTPILSSADPMRSAPVSSSRRDSQIK